MSMIVRIAVFVLFLATVHANAAEDISTLLFDMRNTTVHYPPICELALPFAEKPEERRAYHDVERAWGDVADRADRFEFKFGCRDFEAIDLVTLYFHSGDGWYAQSFPMPKKPTYPGSNLYFPVFKMTFQKHRFEKEGEPGPWRKVDKIRFAFWRGKAIDTEVRIHSLAAVRAPETPLVLTDAKEAEAAKGLTGRLERLGIEFLAVPQEEANWDLIERYRVIVLPMNPNIPEETTRLLCLAIQQGQRVIGFYQVPVAVMREMGFEPGRYLRSPDGDEAFASFRLTDAFSAPVETVPQRSWNIITASPIEESETSPAVGAWWYDAGGRKTEYPALLVSEEGAYFSHVLTSDGDQSKDAFLLALLGRFSPEIWKHAAVRAQEALRDVGDPRNLTPEESRARWHRFLEGMKEKGFDSDWILDTKLGREDVSRYPMLWRLLQEARTEEILRYCRSVSPKTPEFRAWWEHAGTGAYPGDWDRTLRELADSGYTAVIPNMLWGGLAHYESDVLPRSETFRKHGDQIARCVEAAEKHGIEVHVWMVCYNLSTAPEDFVAKMTEEGRTQVKADGTAVRWLCPSHPDNETLQCDALCEIVRKYEIDGVHFDYIRYPDRNHCYCNGCRERFTEDAGIEISQWPGDVLAAGRAKDAFLQWRCDRITGLVARVHKEAKAIKPEIKISAAVFCDYPGSRDWVLQDWPVWVEQGYLDFLCPMSYTDDLDRFESLTEKQQELIKGRIPLYPGIGATATGQRLTPDKVVAQIEIARKHGAGGFVIFNLNADTLRRIPPMTKQGATRP